MAQAPRELQPGEHVSWSYGAGQAKGQVVEKLTENKKLGSRVFKASPDDPKYLVKSDSSGKEAIKKPETLHKIDEDTSDADKEGAPEESMEGGHTSAESDARREEVGAKEKRDGLKQRSTKEEKKEAQNDETAKKVADTGKGSVGASAKAAKKVADTRKGSVGASGKAVKSKLKQVTGGAECVTGGAECAVEDEGKQKDISYRPKKDEVEALDDEEVVLAQVDNEAKGPEGIKAVADEGMKDVAEDEDHTCKPPERELNAPHDEDAIASLPSEGNLNKQVEKENKVVVSEKATKK